MTSIKTPAKLQANSLDQFDQALRKLKMSYRIGLTLIPFIIDDHLSSSLIMENLNGVKGLRCLWRQASEVPNSIPSNQQWILISKGGYVYLITGCYNHNFQLSAYTKPDEKSEEYCDTISQLSKDLDLLPYCLLLTA